MAGDWIKLEHVTPDKPEVFRMAEVLGIDPDAVVGKLVRFWRWCDQQTVDGAALGVSDVIIDRVTHQPGFSAALREVSWLQARSGSLAIPNFDRHNGQTAKARAVENRRKASQRERDICPEKCPDLSGTKPGTETGTREEKRREEIQTGAAAPISVEPQPDLPMPNVLLTEAFKAKWAEYVAYRQRSRMKALKPESVAKQWAEMATWGHEAAVASIDETIRNGWQGLFEPKKGTNAHNRTGNSRSFSQQSNFAGVTDK